VGTTHAIFTKQSASIVSEFGPGFVLAWSGEVGLVSELRIDADRDYLTTWKYYDERNRESVLVSVDFPLHISVGFGGS